MDVIVDLARRSPMETDEQARSLQTKLLELIAKAGKKIGPGVDKVLNDMILSAGAGHGLACAELLHAKLVANGFEVKNVPELVEQARGVLLGISVRDTLLASKAITVIVRQLTKALLSQDKCIRGLGAIKAIVEKITLASPSTVTAVHVDLMLIVLKCHAYDLVADMAFLKPASALLQIEPSAWPIETVDYLQLWYYLGLYHSAMQQFPQAVESFNLALTIPNNGAVSAVQVESYKKMILVSLLASGEAPVLNQRLSSPILLRYLDALTTPYQELAKAYRKCATSTSGAAGSAGSSTASTEISHLVEANGDIFLHDKNLGLVKQILRSLVKKQVTRLTQTYLTFSLADVAAHINMQQQQGAAQAAPAQMAEKYVFDMICARDVFARLDSKASMVRFLEDPEEYDTAPFIDLMDAKIGEIMLLNGALAEKEKALQLTPAYIIKTMRGGAGGGGGAGGMQEAMELAVARGLSLQDQRGGGGFDEEDEMQAAMQASLMQQ